MEDEQTDETQTQTEDIQTEDQTSEGGGEKEVVDYKEQAKQIQAAYTESQQENKKLAARIEALENAQRGTTTQEDEELDLGDEDFIDKKTADKMIDKRVREGVMTIIAQRDKQQAERYFRKTYPDLVKYEGAIAGILQNPKDPEKLRGKTYEDRIDAAVEEFNALTEDAKATATKEAEAKAQEKEEAKRKASGLGSSSTTTTPKSDEEDVSDEDEIKNRKQQQYKRRGLI